MYVSLYLATQASQFFYIKCLSSLEIYFVKLVCQLSFSLFIIAFNCYLSEYRTPMWTHWNSKEYHKSITRYVHACAGYNNDAGAPGAHEFAFQWLIIKNAMQIHIGRNEFCNKNKWTVFRHPNQSEWVTQPCFRIPVAKHNFD